MIKIIAGEKGTGKTALLVDEINNVAADDNNVVCIERGNRLDQSLTYKVRLLNMKEHLCSAYDHILAFLGGICAKDYDLTHIYIDSIKKVSGSDSLEEFDGFLSKLDDFLKNSSIVVTIILSSDVNALPDSIKKFI